MAKSMNKNALAADVEEKAASTAHLRRLDHTCASVPLYVPVARQMCRGAGSSIIALASELRANSSPGVGALIARDLVARRSVLAKRGP